MAPCVYQSPSIERVLGLFGGAGAWARASTSCCPREERGRLLAAARSKGGRQSDAGPEAIECRLRHRDGSLAHFEVAATEPAGRRGVGGIVSTAATSPSARRSRTSSTHQAFHDPLTGLANRALFMRPRRARAAAPARGERPAVAVLFLDLDDFKTVNDSLGHAAGDQLLRGGRRRLQACAAPGDTVARLGGDEFTVLLEDVDERRGRRRRRADPRRAARRRSCSTAARCSSRASIGIAFADDRARRDADELLRNADVAMYTAKAHGKGRYASSSPTMQRRARRGWSSRATAAGASSAASSCCTTSRSWTSPPAAIAGVEALVRWQHPSAGWSPPADSSRWPRRPA